MPRSKAKTRVKLMPCRECQGLMWVGSNTRYAPRCVECGVKASADTIRQLQSRSGPMFDRWLAGCMILSGKDYRGRGEDDK